jgi:hypothetical protein
MFEFGKDLRRLFGQQRESADDSWLELIGVDLLEIEARQQAVAAGRTSCRRPGPAWIRASALWREHARRTGRGASLSKALTAATTAREFAEKATISAEADVATARALMLDHEQRGTPASLDRAALVASGIDGGRAGALAVRASGLDALIRSRQARRHLACLEGPSRQVDAAALLDAALHDFSSHPELQGEAAEVRLERATLMLEGGIRDRNPRLLDWAGRDLRDMIQHCPCDERPITRARALTVCAAGVASLAALADDERAHEQAVIMFETAAEAFTPDHSPLDWVAIVIARRARVPSRPGELRVAQRLTAGEGLILGAQVRACRRHEELAAAEIAGAQRRLMSLENDILNRLASERVLNGPLDWAVEQVALAEVRLAHRQHAEIANASGLTLALSEAADVAREYGAPDIADRADAIRASLWARSRSA